MNPLPGRVYFFRKFEFPDGTKRNKYFVVLFGCPDDSDFVYVASTTSNKNHSEPVAGCHSDHPACFFVNDIDTPIKGDTRVMLSDVYYIKYDLLKIRCDYMGEFNLDLTVSILDCATTSNTLTGYEIENAKKEANLLRP